TQIMLNIHNRGKEVCGIYPREIAETKVEIVHKTASDRGFPLRSTMEKE
ncbi:MAG: ATP-dependent Clp protease adaptor ClpS, partial [Desulfobacteraceae bacterium]